MFNRTIAKCLSPLLKMMYRLMSTASPWKRMAHGLEIWNCKLLLLLLVLIFAYIE